MIWQARAMSRDTLSGLAFVCFGNRVITLAAPGMTADEPR